VLKKAENTTYRKTENGGHPASTDGGRLNRRRFGPNWRKSKSSNQRGKEKKKGVKLIQANKTKSSEKDIIGNRRKKNNREKDKKKGVKEEKKPKREKKG